MWLILQSFVAVENNLKYGHRGHFFRSIRKYPLRGRKREARRKQK